MIATAAMLAALSAVLMMLEMPLPFMPMFLKLDLSDVPVLIGAVLMGPLPGIAIAFFKDVVHIFISGSSTGGVGELADFLMSAALILPSSLILRRRAGYKPLMAGCAFGIALMTGVGALTNFYILLPAYSMIMPLKQIFAMCAKVNPLIVSKGTYILYAIVPFNIFKGLLISAVTVLVYKKLSAFFSTRVLYAK